MKILTISLLSLGLLSANVYAIDNAQPSTNETLTMQSLAEKNKTEGDNFLANNKNQPGVVTLSDGLQYKVMTAGKGEKPTANDIVTVDYAGRLINGTEFDSSYKRGQPMTFQLSDVIPGWVEALQLMTVGSTWEIYIPASLAYGTQGAPPVIGPNQTLIFKVTLISIKKA